MLSKMDPRSHLSRYFEENPSNNAGSWLNQLTHSIENCAVAVDQQLHRQLINGLMREVLLSNKRLNAAVEEVTRLSVTDQLTGLYNRRRGMEVLHQEYLKFLRMGHPVSLISFDIDHFKGVNDKFGHDVGDAALTNVSRIAQKTLRDVDVLARWGGEEFLIVCAGTTLDHACNLAERLRMNVFNDIHPVYGHITCSFGISCFARNYSEADALKKADEALYKAKEGGRNRIERAVFSITGGIE